MKLIICRGLPATGKTTWSKQWVKENPEKRVRFNRDDCRFMLGKYWVPEREIIIDFMFDAFLKSAVAKGYDIVVDNCNLSSKTVDLIISKVEELLRNSGNEFIEVEYRNFYADIDECIKRDSKREHPVMAENIIAMYSRYKDLIDSFKDRPIGK